MAGGWTIERPDRHVLLELPHAMLEIRVAVLDFQ
jgi:hypothetical protein